MKTRQHEPHVAIIGGGFSGLSAAYELSKQGIRGTIYEKEHAVGGLAGSFSVGGVELEKFYHHWFTSDEHVMQLVKELETEDRILHRPTRTGMYYANNFYRLSSPLDVLRFKPLSLINRIRLGLLVLRARRVKNWMELESMSAEEWLIKLCGKEVYNVVWEPLLRGKFGPYASEVSAVWFWNKLKLRGGSRGKGAGEVLAYYRGGFAALAEQMALELVTHGWEIRTDTGVEGITVEDGRVTALKVNDQRVPCDAVIATPALPQIAKLMKPHVAPRYVDALNRIDYLANVCLVLELDRSLSNTYWLNVNDPSFPFVGVIEHTNFEPPESYNGTHIVYLSKYLPASAELYNMTENEVLKFTIPHLQRMFPKFERSWVKRFHVWRARYSQPIVTRNYSKLIPPVETPLDRFYICTMAQVYPEDRGTNYAIREGRKVGSYVAEMLKTPRYRRQDSRTTTAVNP